MSKVYRVYVEKKSAYAIEANELLNNIQTQLKIETVTDVHVVNRYDLQGVSEDVLKQGIPTILSEPMVDEIYQEDYPLNEHQKAFAIEFLPGQYDQRADACEQCFQVLTGEKNVKVKCAKLIVLYFSAACISVHCVFKQRKHNAINNISPALLYFFI